LRCPYLRYPWSTASREIGFVWIMIPDFSSGVWTILERGKSLTAKLTCRGRLQHHDAARNQYGGPGQVQRLVRRRLADSSNRQERSGSLSISSFGANWNFRFPTRYSEPASQVTTECQHRYPRVECPAVCAQTRWSLLSRRLDPQM
jgi:hypothetical protein